MENKKKVIVIGANHSGTSVINTIADNSNEWEINVYDSNTNCSFLGCGIALWISGIVEDPQGLFYSSPEALEAKGAKVHMQHLVENIDFDNKKVTVKNLINGETFDDTYDKLVISSGSQPFDLKFDGKSFVDYDNVKNVKLYQHAGELIEILKKPEIKKVSVVGGGYIGAELVEAVKVYGKEVKLIDFSERLLGRYYDKEFTDKMEAQMKSQGIELLLGQKVESIKTEGNNVTELVTNKGSVETDLVILCVGAKPNTDWINNDKLERIANGAIVVNEKQETSIQDVYSIGDSSAVIDSLTGEPVSIALASNAVRTGKVAGFNIIGVNNMELNTVQGSNAISIFGLNMVSTGKTSDAAKMAGIETEESFYVGDQKLAFMNEDHEVSIKVIYNKENREIVGAQMASTYDISLGIHLFTLAIAKKVTIDEFKFMDLFFLPHFNTPFNYINEVALKAAKK